LGENIVTSITEILVAPSCSNVNIKSAHSHLLAPRFALRYNGCHRHVLSSTCCHWISCERSNLVAVIYEWLRSVYGDACVGAGNIRKCVKRFKDEKTDIAYQLRCGRRRNSGTWAQQAKCRRDQQTRL